MVACIPEQGHAIPLTVKFGFTLVLVGCCLACSFAVVTPHKGGRLQGLPRRYSLGPTWDVGCSAVSE